MYASGHEPLETDKPTQAYLIPMYYRSPDWCGFLSRPNPVRPLPARDRFGRSRATQAQAERVRRGFYGEPITICLEVDLRAWPKDVERYEKLVTESLEIFFAFIESGTSVLGQ